jgi:hypothetical protein
MKVRQRLAILFGLIAVLALGAVEPVSAGPGGGWNLSGVDGRKLEVATQFDSATASTTQVGLRSWFFIIRNGSGSEVTNATISANSGYSPARFGQSGKCGPIFNSFPVVVANQASLPPAQFLNGGLCSSIPVSFTTGFNSSRTITPLEVPAGGGRQSVTVTMTLTDSRYAAGNIVKVTVLADDLPGETIACSTASAAPPNQWMQCDSTRVEWNLNNLALGVPVQFAVSVDVPNASTHPIWHKPSVWTLGEVNRAITVSGPASGLVIPDSTLDGPTQGAGAVTYSVSQGNLTWGTEVSDNYQVSYAPVLSNNDLNLVVSVTPSVATNGTNVMAAASVTNMSEVSRQVTVTGTLYFLSPTSGSVPISSTSSSFSVAPGQDMTRQFPFTVTPSTPRGAYQLVATATDVTGTTQQKAFFTIT